MFEQEGGGTALADRPENHNAKPRTPSRHNVILYDDPEHTFTYVMEMLQELFGYEKQQAYEMTEDLVENQKTIVYTASNRDEAVLKKDQILSYGRDKANRDCKGAMGVEIESV